MREGVYKGPMPQLLTQDHAHEFTSAEEEMEKGGGLAVCLLVNRYLSTMLMNWQSLRAAILMEYERGWNQHEHNLLTGVISIPIIYNCEERLGTGPKACAGQRPQSCLAELFIIQHTCDLAYRYFAATTYNEKVGWSHYFLCPLSYKFSVINVNFILLPAINEVACLSYSSHSTQINWHL